MNSHARARHCRARAFWPLLVLAGQLVAERGERLVGSQGASRRAVATAGGGRGGGGRRGAPLAAPVAALGPCVAPVATIVLGGLVTRLGDLAPVCLEPRPRLGVLLLPLFALGLVAFEPLPGLGVEALGVDVVALLVVLGGHAVQRRVEVVPDRLADRALVRLLERQ